MEGEFGHVHERTEKPPVLLDDRDGGSGEASFRHPEHQQDDLRDRHVRTRAMPLFPRNLGHSTHNGRGQTHHRYKSQNVKTLDEICSF
jgi:hypothetical protein